MDLLSDLKQLIIEEYKKWDLNMKIKIHISYCMNFLI